ncbi:carotenoid oxygenase family protein [Neobacillus sp. Marseille-QA0830]
MTKFPDSPIYTGFNMPFRAEVDIHDVEVEGNLPTEINGAYYRVGPDPQYPPLLGEDIYFNGDGMVSMFHFKNGHVDFKCRYVKTDKFNLERQAGRALFGAYRNPFFDDPSVKGEIRGTANTHVIFHNGELFALKEDSPPVAMDPLTLETKGYWDYHGKLTSQTFTAHPKIDPQTGEMIAFGYGTKGIGTPDITYYAISPSGEITREVEFLSPYPAMIHDFAVTRDYVIFPVIPMTSSIDRAREGKPTFGWDGTKEVFLGVLPRKGEARDVRWFRGPTQFASHVMNAFNEGTKIYLDMPVAEGNMFPFFPDIHGAEFSREKAASHLTRWIMDMESATSTFTHRQLSDTVGEFPRIDERYAMEHYRHGFLCVTDFSRPRNTQVMGSITGMFINCLGHVDLATGKEQIYFCGPESTLQEPTFIPKSDNAAEGEGYLVALVNRYDEMRSDLVVLDAQHLNDGPVARVKLPIRLRQGLHGSWVTEAQLMGAKH